MSKIYIAKYSTGSYDDYHEINIFSSLDREKVEKWVDKFNKKLGLWQLHFSQFSSEYSRACIKDEFLNKINCDTFWAIMECGSASIEEIELR